MGDTDPERFVLASVVLTGFSEFELYATGRVSEYHAFLHGVVSREVDAIATELADLPADPADRDRRIRSRVLDDTDLGPVARSLIRLWYLGRWDDPRDPTESRIVSPMAYRAGLAWDAIEAHPPGAEQQGFGSWADRPAGGSPMKLVTAGEAARTSYDAVVVGGGIAGALVAKQLSRAGKSCLVLEAGTGAALDYTGYLGHVDEFHLATAKTPNSAYPPNPNAPEPMLTDIEAVGTSPPGAHGYLVQQGPMPFNSTYTRYLGGTSLHWLGTCLRMLPEDFRLASEYEVGTDWPIDYGDLEPWYAAAERELGVAGDVGEQDYLGVRFGDGYVFPMFGLPSSWSDRRLADRIDGMRVEAGGRLVELEVRGTPVARNGVPNPDYDDGNGYRTQGAVGDPAIGHRCMGNTSCVPICPIQAKYNALKTLSQADHDHIDVLLRAVAFDLPTGAGGRVSGVRVKHYESPDDPAHRIHEVHGTVVVLAAHAVANAILMMTSGIGGESGQLGANLMDHPVLLTWGLADEPLWPFRGPLATSGIEDLRGGAFRNHHAAFRMELGNEGWQWPTGAPVSNVYDLVDSENLYGERLRRELRREVSRQFRFAILVEQLPEPGNRVSVDPRYVDRLGNHRPVIEYDLSPYTKAGFVEARRVARQVFERAGITDRSTYATSDPGYFTWGGHGLVATGAGHYAGTHRMGSSPGDSVVDERQRCWGHENLYLVGCGNMVTTGTSNPTLTMAALSLWAAHNILDDLSGPVS